jgi:hypothetical protein
VVADGLLSALVTSIWECPEQNGRNRYLNARVQRDCFEYILAVS